MRRALAITGGALLVVVLTLGGCGQGCLSQLASHTAARTEEGRASYVAAWRAAREGFDKSFRLERAWLDPLPRGTQDPGPLLGCVLPWEPTTRESVRKSAEQCGEPPVRPSPEQLALLKTLAESNAKPPRTLEPAPPWLTGLEQYGPWRCLSAGPLGREDRSPWDTGQLAWPTLDVGVLRGWTRARLLEARKPSQLEAAVSSNLQLARLLLDCEVLPVQLAGLAVLEAQAEYLDKRRLWLPRLPSRASLEASRRARYAAAQTLHPWLDAEARALPADLLPESVRCTALVEGAFWAGMAPVLEGQHAAYYERWRQPETLQGWCSRVDAQGPWLLAREVPQDVWERLPRRAGPQAQARWLWRLARLHPHARNALGDLWLGLTTSSPLPHGDGEGTDGMDF